MRWATGVAAALLLLLLGFGGAPRAVVPTDRPHGFMEDEARCGGCHRVEPEGEDWVLDPHIFVRPVVSVCRTCHPPEQIGRSHPVDVDPLRIMDARDLPPSLPLHWSDEERAEVMTCGTCHNPHLPRVSDQKLHSRQRPLPGASGYLTYYLRMRGQTTRESFTPLCRACHPKL